MRESFRAPPAPDAALLTGGLAHEGPPNYAVRPAVHRRALVGHGHWRKSIVP